MIVIESESLTEVVTGFGVKGVTSENVAAAACAETEAYIGVNAPVGTHLADQLLIQMALARGGCYRPSTPTPHTLTNAAVIGRFVDVSITIDEESDGAHRVTVRPGRRETPS